MKRIIVLLLFLITISCARKAEVRGPELIKKDRFAYIKDDNGRLYIVTKNTKDLDEAMKAIHPGPSSVDKLDLWVITPLRPKKK